MSLRSLFETHPERFPNLTWRKAEEGVTHVFFLRKRPSPPSDSAKKPTSNSSPSEKQKEPNRQALLHGYAGLPEYLNALDGDARDHADARFEKDHERELPDNPWAMRQDSPPDSWLPAEKREETMTHNRS